MFYATKQKTGYLVTWLAFYRPLTGILDPTGVIADAMPLYRVFICICIYWLKLEDSLKWTAHTCTFSLLLQPSLIIITHFVFICTKIRSIFHIGLPDPLFIGSSSLDTCHFTGKMEISQLFCNNILRISSTRQHDTLEF